MKKSILIGKRDNRKVILEVELTEVQSKGKITTLLTPAPPSYKQLSICGSIGSNWCGQIYDEIYPSLLDEIYVDEDWLIKLIAIWKAAHLNDTNAGTELQMEYANYFVKHYRNDKYDYKEVCQMLKQHSLLIDKETNPDLSVGYPYGTLWLLRLLPDSIEEFFQSINSTPKSHLRSEMMDYLLKNNYKWIITPTDINPNMESNQPMDHWKCVFKNVDNNQFTTYFSTGLGHRLYPTEKQASLNIIAMNWAKKKIRLLGHPDKLGKWRTTIKQLGLYVDPAPLASFADQSIYEGIRKSPMPDEVIKCICGDWLSIEGYNDWSDWASDLGYDLGLKDQRMIAKTAYLNIQKQSDKAQIFFGNNWSELCDRSY